MVALIVSLVITFAMAAGIFVYAKRRKVGTPVTWGEAVLAGTYVFALSSWSTASCRTSGSPTPTPTFSWRKDKILAGPGSTGFLEWLPFTITKYTLRDVVVTVIYIVFFGAADRRVDAVAEPRQDEADRHRDLDLRPSAGEGELAMARTDANPPMPEFRDDYMLVRGRRRLPREGGEAEAVPPHRPVRVHHVRGLRRHLPVEVHPHGLARRDRRGGQHRAARASTPATTSCSSSTRTSAPGARSASTGARPASSSSASSAPPTATATRTCATSNHGYAYGMRF